MVLRECWLSVLVVLGAHAHDSACVVRLVALGVREIASAARAVLYDMRDGTSALMRLLSTPSEAQHAASVSSGGLSGRGRSEMPPDFLGGAPAQMRCDCCSALTSIGNETREAEVRVHLAGGACMSSCDSRGSRRISEPSRSCFRAGLCFSRLTDRYTRRVDYVSGRDAL